MLYFYVGMVLSHDFSAAYGTSLLDSHKSEMLVVQRPSNIGCSVYHGAMCLVRLWGADETRISLEAHCRWDFILRLDWCQFCILNWFSPQIQPGYCLLHGGYSWLYWQLSTQLILLRTLHYLRFPYRTMTWPRLDTELIGLPGKEIPLKLSPSLDPLLLMLISLMEK